MKQKKLTKAFMNIQRYIYMVQRCKGFPQIEDVDEQTNLKDLLGTGVLVQWLKTACMERQKSRAWTPLWPPSFKNQNVSAPLPRED